VALQIEMILLNAASERAIVALRYANVHFLMEET